MKTIYDPAYRRMVEELRQARRRAGISQSDLARRIGSGRSRQFVHLYESGQSRLDVVQICRVCRLLGLKAHVLVRRMEEELPEEGDSFYLLEPMPMFVVLSRSSVDRHVRFMSDCDCI